MWEYEHSAETTAAPQVVWRLWSDVAGWPQWNNGIEKITVDGPFAVGTTFTMTPPGDEPIRMRLAERLHLRPQRIDGVHGVELRESEPRRVTEPRLLGLRELLEQRARRVAVSAFGKRHRSERTQPGRRSRHVRGLLET